ncbi:MAG: zinc-binding dehydrogenase [Acidimicrobiia bacterium]|nr:zinc-binding dehydrogenase [Acidimicrobiia bacterium]
MKAVSFATHGELDVLTYGDFPEPDLEAGFVRVRVGACSLNYHDVFTRRGMPGIKVPLPMIPGCDAAGTVAEVGAEVDTVAVGDRVLVDPVYGDPHSGRFFMIGDTWLGAYAETIKVHASQLIPLPDDVSFADAACLPVAYGTAHRMLFTRGRLQAGETILILGASGGVGTCCVLLAKMVGAHVIAAAGSPDKCERLRELGADETIDYSSTDYAAYTRERTGTLFSGGGWDVVVNFTGGDTWARSLRCVKQGGRVLTCGATAGFDPPTDLRFIWTAEMDILGSNGWKRDDLTRLLDLVRRDELRPVIDQRLPLERGVEAMGLLEERRFFGKIVIEP